MDIASRHDLVRLVDTFYDRIRRDDLLGPIFNDVARVNWQMHLPKMYDFWESVLFGTAAFKGNPQAVHLALSRRTPLTAIEFGRWIELFHATVDDGWRGPIADEARRRAARIAAVMQEHIGAQGEPAVSVQTPHAAAFDA